VLKNLLADPGVPDVAAVERAEIAQHKRAVWLRDYVRVLFRNNPIEDLHRVVRVPPDRIEFAKFKFLPDSTGE
jgi:hypothetical protein